MCPAFARLGEKLADFTGVNNQVKVLVVQRNARTIPTTSRQFLSRLSIRTMGPRMACQARAREDFKSQQR